MTAEAWDIQLHQDVSGGIAAFNSGEAAQSQIADVVRDLSRPRALQAPSAADALSLHLGPDAAPVGGWTKRVADIVIASVALVLAAPLMLLVWVLIVVTTGRPAFFSHQRMGFRGRPFSCYKFRTMKLGADKILRDYLAANPDAAREWSEKRKLRHDPRMTWIGGALRKSSIDELPQLINILRGDMSSVGPRPIVAEELPRYGIGAREYLRARPGLTGLWQVSGRSTVSYGLRIHLDCQYVQNWSLGADLMILIRTIFAVSRFRDAS